MSILKFKDVTPFELDWTALYSARPSPPCLVEVFYCLWNISISIVYCPTVMRAILVGCRSSSILKHSAWYIDIHLCNIPSQFM